MITNEEDDVWIVYVPPGEDTPVVRARRASLVFVSQMPDNWQAIFRYRDEAETFATELTKNQAEL